MPTDQPQARWGCVNFIPIVGAVSGATIGFHTAGWLGLVVGVPLGIVTAILLLSLTTYAAHRAAQKTNPRPPLDPTSTRPPTSDPPHH